MPVERLLPDAESEALVALAREIAAGELKPMASEYEAKSEFPREQFRLLGRSGLLGLPYPEEWGGGAVSYEVYLQVLEDRDLVSSAELVVADGMPLIWAANVQGQRLPERVTGSSMTISMAAAAGRAGASVFLLGGNPGTAELAAEALRNTSPGLHISGTLCPPLGFEEDRGLMENITREVVDADPAIVYVALGFPKQELLILALREHLPKTWFMPCGISFSFLAGEIRRAPLPMQRLGLEWLHRLAQEPRRLGQRYLMHDTRFMVTLFSESLRARGELQDATAQYWPSSP